MNFLLDIIFIILIIVFIVAGAKKGLVKSLLDGLTSIISGVIAYLVAEPVSNFIYETAIRNFVKSKITDVLSLPSNDFNSITERVNAMVNEIPEGAVKLAAKFGFNINAEITAIVQKGSNEKNVLIEAVMSNIVDNVLTVLIEAIVLISLFVIISIILSAVIRFFDDIIEKIPLVKETNKITGGILGLLKAVVIIFVASTVLFFVAGVSDNEEFISVIYSSKIFELVNNNNPLLNIFI